MIIGLDSQEKCAQGHHDFCKIVAEQFTGIGITEGTVIASIRETGLNQSNVYIGRMRSYWYLQDHLENFKTNNNSSKQSGHSPPENIKAIKEKLVKCSQLVLKLNLF